MTERINPSDISVIRREGESHLFLIDDGDESDRNRFYGAIDLMGSDPVSASLTFKELIQEYPAHLDAMHHLALISDPDTAYTLLEEAVQIGLDALPENFYFGKDQLPWLSLGNRPFLRAYHAFGLMELEHGNIEKATIIFENILSVNPSDNQGIRVLLADCYFELKRPIRVIEILQNFTDDALASTLYNRALAHFQMDELLLARKYLLDAVKYSPLVADEIVNGNCSDLEPTGSITLGSREEAQEYSSLFGQYWVETPGALEFLQEQTDTRLGE